MQCPNSHHVHASSNEENAEVSRMINLAQRSPEFPQWLLFTWTEDATGQCLRQLHCVHRCYYKRDRQRDISFLKTIFFPQLRTRGAIPFPPSSLSAARDGGAEGARNACVEPQFFAEVTECNYGSVEQESCVGFSKHISSGCSLSATCNLAWGKKKQSNNLWASQFLLPLTALTSCLMGKIWP